MLQRSLALSEATTSAPDITYIFTDSQSSSDIGSATAQEYETSAKKRRCPFVSIILSCHLEENMRRLQAVGRGESTNTKLTDLDIFRSIRETRISTTLVVQWNWSLKSPRPLRQRLLRRSMLSFEKVCPHRRTSNSRKRHLVHSDGN